MAWRAASALVALESLTNLTRPTWPTVLMRCASRVLPIVFAGQAWRAQQVGYLDHPVASGVIEHAGQGIDAAPHGPARADRPDGAPVGGGDLGADLLAIGIIDADDGRVALALVEQHPLLGGHIAVHAAVAVKVI